MERISAAMHKYIFRRAASLFHHVFHVQEPDFVEWGEYVYNVLFGDEDFDMLEDEISLGTPTIPIYLVDCIHIESIAGYRHVDYYGRPSDLMVRFKYTRDWPRFDRIGNLATMPPRPAPFCVTLLDHPAWYEFRDAIMAYDAATQEYRTKLACFLEYVDKICGHYSTINEVLAVCPAVRFLLPNELQIQEFPFDGSPKALPDGVDIAELTAAVVRAKLTEV